MSPEQFGIYSIQFIVFSFINSIFMVPAINGFKTYYSKDYNINILKFFENLILKLSLLAFTLFLCVNLLNIVAFTYFEIIIISFTLFLQTLFSLYLALANLNSFHSKFGKSQIINSGFNLILLILAFTIFSINNSLGLWIVAVFTAAFSILLLKNRMNTFIKFSNPENLNPNEIIQNVKLGPELISYFLPLILLAFVSTINNYGDRYILSLIMTLEDVGLYSVVYSFGAKITILATPVITYLTPIVFKMNSEGSKNINSKINRALLIHAAAGLIIVFFLAIFYNQIGALFLSKHYQESFFIIPLIALAFLIFNSVFIIETKFYATGKTRFILTHHIFGAIFNITLNFLLIPYFGLLGAAISAIFSFLSQLVISYYLMLRY